MLTLLAAAIATGAAVATAGAIGFVGLVVPHALAPARRARRARCCCPPARSAAAPSSSLVDAAARTVVAPLQLPVGVLAAAIGVPAFIAMLLHRPATRRGE